jgi:hypothetical protein
VITEMRPIHPATGPDSFQVTAAADQFGIAGTWSMQVFAFCAVVPASVQLEIRTLTNPPTSAAVDQAVTRCSPGKVVMSTGGKIDNGNGQVDLGTVPTSSGSLATGSSAIAKEDADGFAGFYTVTGYSVCGRPNLLPDAPGAGRRGRRRRRCRRRSRGTWTPRSSARSNSIRHRSDHCGQWPDRCASPKREYRFRRSAARRVPQVLSVKCRTPM